MSGWPTAAESKDTPQPNPVWFTWDGGVITVFREPIPATLRSIALASTVRYTWIADANGEIAASLATPTELLIRNSVTWRCRIDGGPSRTLSVQLTDHRVLIRLR
jgi:hypothetical protein